MPDKLNRSWCGRAQYPGLKPFHFGTVVLPQDASEMEAERALVELWAEMSPHPAPAFVAVPGAMFFQPETGK